MSIIDVFQRIESLLTEIKDSVSRPSANLDPHIRWLDAEEVAAMIGYTPWTFRNSIANRSGFPKPSRPTGGQARWNAEEVSEWMSRQRTKSKAGRPRAA